MCQFCDAEIKGGAKPAAALKGSLSAFAAHILGLPIGAVEAELKPVSLPSKAEMQSALESWNKQYEDAFTLHPGEYSMKVTYVNKDGLEIEQAPDPAQIPDLEPWQITYSNALGKTKLSAESMKEAEKWLYGSGYALKEQEKQAPEYANVAQAYGFTQDEISAWVRANDSGVPFNVLADILTDTPIPHSKKMTPQRKKDERDLIRRLDEATRKYRPHTHVSVGGGVVDWGGVVGSYVPKMYEDVFNEQQLPPSSFEFHTYKLGYKVGEPMFDTAYYLGSEQLYVVKNGVVQSPKGALKPKAHDWIPGFVIMSHE